MPTTTERGLGWEHQKQRRRLLARHVDGTLCDHCRLPMYRAQALQADHETPRSLGGKRADRLLHAWCNESRGNGTRIPASDGALRDTVTSRGWLTRTPRLKIWKPAI